MFAEIKDSSDGMIDGLDSSTNSNTGFFYDPELTLECSAGHCVEQTSSDLQYMHARLASQPQYDQPGICAWRVSPDIRKISIKRDDSPTLAQTG